MSYPTPSSRRSFRRIGEEAKQAAGSVRCNVAYARKALLRACAGVLVVLLAGCHGGAPSDAESQTAANAKVAVTTIVPAQQTFHDTVEAYGSAVGDPNHARAISLAHGGQVVALNDANELLSLVNGTPSASGGDATPARAEAAPPPAAGAKPAKKKEPAAPPRPPARKSTAKKGR